uniref:ATP binding protein n=1 Tax=Solanum tuberosum TaxID=4113 RepID=M1C227_SOLTU
MEILQSMAAVVTIATGVVVYAKLINGNRNLFSELKKKFSNKVTMVIDEFDEIYEAVEIYLTKNMSPKKCKIKVSTTETGEEKENENNPIKIILEHNEKVTDFYDDHKFKWVWLQSEVKSFNLIFRKEDYEYVLDTYLSHIRK